MDSIKTPRGTFQIGFNTLAEAQEAGYSIHFNHEGYVIVSNGTNAFAVKKNELKLGDILDCVHKGNGFEMTPSKWNKK